MVSPVIPLDFDDAVFDRPPTPARLFEVFRQSFIVIRGQVEVFDQRHHLAAAPFRGPMDDGGLLRRRVGKTLRGRWLPFAQVALLGRIHQGIRLDSHTWSLPMSASQDMRDDAGCTSRRASTSLAGDLLDQRLKGTPEVCHIVECFLRNGLRHGLGLSPIQPEALPAMG